MKISWSMFKLKSHSIFGNGVGSEYARPRSSFWNRRNSFLIRHNTTSVVSESDVQLLNPTFSFWIPSGDSESDSNLHGSKERPPAGSGALRSNGSAWEMPATDGNAQAHQCTIFYRILHHSLVFCYAVCEIPSESKASFHRAAPRELAVGTKKSSKGSWRINYAWEVLTRSSPDLLPKK